MTGETTMTETTTPAKQRIDRRKRYRRLMNGSLLVGIIGILAGSYLGQYLAGVLIYWTGFFGMLAIWQFSPVTLYDERDAALERKASYYTLGGLAIAGVLAIPGLVALETEGVLTLPAGFDGAALLFVAVYALFAVIYIGLRLRA